MEHEPFQQEDCVCHGVGGTSMVTKKKSVMVTKGVWEMQWEDVVGRKGMGVFAELRMDLTQ